LSDAVFEPAYVAQLSVPALAPGETNEVSYSLAIRSLTGAYLLPIRVLSGTRVMGSVAREAIVVAVGPLPTLETYPQNDSLHNPVSFGESSVGRRYVSSSDTPSGVFWGIGIVLILLVLYVFRERIYRFTSPERV
jgi:hypothetical protein